MPRPTFTLKTLLVISFGIALFLGLRVGWFRGQTNAVYLVAVCASCAFFGAAVVMIYLQRND